MNSCPFIVQQNQSNVRFLFLPSRELYRNHTVIFAYAYCSAAYNLFVNAELYSLKIFTTFKYATFLNTRLTELLLIQIVTSCPFIVQQDQSNERSRNVRFLFSPSIELYRNHTIIFTLAYLWSRRDLVCSVCSVILLYGLLDSKAWVRIPGQLSKMKYAKYFFGAFILADFWQKLWK